MVPGHALHPAHQGHIECLVNQAADNSVEVLLIHNAAQDAALSLRVEILAT